MVLPARLAWWAEREPDRPFLQEVTGRSTTYGEFMVEIRRWCTVLREAGVAPGDRLMSMLPASIDAAALWIAAGSIGALEVSVNPDLRGSFLEHALRDPDARWCFVRPEHADLPGTVSRQWWCHVMARSPLALNPRRSTVGRSPLISRA